MYVEYMCVRGDPPPPEIKSQLSITLPCKEKRRKKSSLPSAQKPVSVQYENKHSMQSFGSIPDMVLNVTLKPQLKVAWSSSVKLVTGALRRGKLLVLTLWRQ